MGDVENARSSGGLRCTVSSGAPGAGFAPGKIENAGTPSVGVHRQKRATAGLLDIVAMRGNSKNVDR
jgi:hypothetical protein